MRHWFKAKTIGYGWYPVTWEGWLVLAGYLGAVLFLVLKFEPALDSGDGVLSTFLPAFLLLTAALIVICVKKGEKARWRWPWSK